MTKLNVADWVLDAETRFLVNAKLQKELVLTEAQANILMSLFEDPDNTIDLNDLASIGWPKEKVFNEQIASCIDEINKILCDTMKIEFSDVNGACLAATASEEIDGVQGQANDEAEKNEDPVNALDMKTIFAAIVIVAITAVIMIYS